VLRAQRLCVVAMADGDVPYAVPVYYGFDGTSLYLGIAEGRKTEVLDRNTRVCAVVTEPGPGDAWRSVMVVGRAVSLSDPNERARGIAVLTEHNRRPDRPAQEAGGPSRRAAGGRVLMIADAEITGRARRPR